MADLSVYTPSAFGRLPEVNMTEGAVRQKIRNGEIEAVQIDGRYFITPTAAKRFVESWPSRNKGVSARWRSYRAFKAAMIATGAAA